LCRTPVVRALVLLVSGLIILIVAVADWWTKPYVSLGFLYLFPIMLLYGSAEGGTTAFECLAGSLHVASEAVWVETKSCNTFVTDMMLRAFPLIRYSIGDEVLAENEPCSCGRPHPVLRSVEGRSGEPILLPNGRRINANPS